MCGCFYLFVSNHPDSYLSRGHITAMELYVSSISPSFSDKPQFIFGPMVMATQTPLSLEVTRYPFGASIAV